jgi:hypothetical protein
MLQNKDFTELLKRHGFDMVDDLAVYFRESDPIISGQSGRQLDCRVQ